MYCNIMRVGDRVIFYDQPAIIVDVNGIDIYAKFGSRYKYMIRLLNGAEVVAYELDDIKLDTKYYRDIKIDIILAQL